jgi:hypothetical protein
MLRSLLLLVSLFFSACALGNCPPPGCGSPIPLPQNIPIHHTTLHHHGALTATLLTGSVKANVERIANEQGWPEVVWRVPYDYKWVGQTQIQADSLAGLLSQLLRNYPLQAVLYHGNHILAIYPRVLK